MPPTYRHLKMCGIVLCTIYALMAVTRVRTTVVHNIFEVHLGYLDIPDLTTNQVEIIYFNSSETLLRKLENCHELSLPLHCSGFGGYFELEPIGLQV